MNSFISWAALCGFGFGLGVWIILVNLPGWRKMAFAERIAPHVRVGVRSSRMLEDSWHSESGHSALAQLASPMIAQIRKFATSHNPSNDILLKKLNAAGLELSVIDYRAQEIICALVGIVVGSVFTAVASLQYDLSLVSSVLIAICCGMLGYALRGWWLGEQIHRRSRKILTQFPTVAEVLALTVGAGESTTGAIERISRICHGVIGEEFVKTLNDIHAGTPMFQAMQNMSDRMQVGTITRFVDAIVVATERGTPLAQVLRDQAQDVRDASKRELMEVAGKREILMLVPVVFGILPLTIIFAVFPGLALLEMSY